MNLVFLYKNLTSERNLFKNYKIKNIEKKTKKSTLKNEILTISP